MKKLFLFACVCSFALFIAGCGSEENKESNVAATENEIARDQEAVLEGENAEEVENSEEDMFAEEIEDFQIHFVMHTQEKGVEVASFDMFMYQKEGKSLYDIQAMDISGEQMPFVMKKILTVADKTYSLFSINGDDKRFYTTGSDASMAPNMFDFKAVQEELKTWADTKKEETINGKDMTCYYAEQTGSMIKACTTEDILGYMEEKNEETDTFTTVTTDGFSRDVADAVFAEPSGAKPMEEFYQFLMPQDQ